MINESEQNVVINLIPAQLDYLFSAEAVLDRGQRMLQRCLDGDTHFFINWNKLDPLADFILAVCQQNYPDGGIPLHSRWRHFEIKGENWAKQLWELHYFSNQVEQLKAQFDLAIISVLLDAGAGSEWCYYDKNSGASFKRSEGLAVATLQLFLAGFFSNDSHQPLRVDAARLQQIDVQELAAALQVNETNKLFDLEGRLLLLHQLAAVLQQRRDYFSGQRPGDLYDVICAKNLLTLCATELLRIVLKAFAKIWPSRIVATLQGTHQNDRISLGDVWHYQPWADQTEFLALVPLHKLSIWLTLSLIEPLQAAKINVINIEQLPGLAEYRNGGLLIDSGLLALKNAEKTRQAYQASDALIIEWRALTIALLTQLSLAVRYKLGLTAKQLPTVTLLQGGTWIAGRQLAYQQRADGSPPLIIHSDATVF